MSASALQVLDVGTAIIRTLFDEDAHPIDLTAASTITFTFKKPSGSIVEYAGEVYGAATDGRVRYVFQADELDEAGEWQLQLYIALPTGAWRTGITKFQVNDNLE